MRTRISSAEIMQRLGIGWRRYHALIALPVERGGIPHLRIGRSVIITRHSYEDWERKCGMHAAAHQELLVESRPALM